MIDISKEVEITGGLHAGERGEILSLKRTVSQIVSGEIKLRSGERVIVEGKYIHQQKSLFDF